MSDDEMYKYLGMNQSNSSFVKSVKEQLSIEFKNRLHKTFYKFHHPKSCLERMTTPSKEGGCGLLDRGSLRQKE